MTAFDAFLEPARTRPGFWRVILGLLLIVAVYLVGALVVLMGWLAVNFARTGDLNLALAQLDQVMQGGEPWLILVILLTFVGIWPGTWAAMRLLHGQRFGTIFAPVPGGAVSGFLKGAVLGLLFSGPSLLVALLLAEPERSTLGLGQWAVFLVPVVLAVFIQATGEELIFRGYLLQQLAIRVRSPLVWALLPGLLFGLLHYNNPNGPEGTLPQVVAFGISFSVPGLLYVATTAITGAALAALVWRSGSLWPAAGVHVAVNMFSLSLVGAEGILSGTQLWLFSISDMARLLWINVAASVLLLVAILSPLGRVFEPGAPQAPPRA